MNPSRTSGAGASDLDALHERFRSEILEIDRELVAYLERFESSAHYGMIRYHLGFADRELRNVAPDAYLPRGKRLRPIVCLLFCRMFELDAAIARIVMMATEAMHAASLVHDDIEDNDAVRWGRPTIQSLFGIDQAINVGDALTGLVYHLLLSLRSQGVDAAAVTDVVAIFNATHLEMCEGQQLDLARTFADDLSLADYIEMVRRKTASQCVCIADAISALAAAPADRAATLRRFALALGLLYQVCDDIRGIWCGPDALGRSIGQDIRQRRASLPLLYGAKHGSPALHQALGTPPAGDEGLGEDAIAVLRRELVACGAHRLCLDVASGYYRDALDALAELHADGPEGRILRGILETCFGSVASVA